MARAALRNDNSDAKTTIVTVLTVLAGFMIAIITVLGDPASIPDGSWRMVEFDGITLKTEIIPVMRGCLCGTLCLLVFYLWE